MAERYAPLKNAGGAFITQALREKTSWTLTMSKDTNPSLMRALGRNNGTGVSNSDSTSDGFPTATLSGTSEIPSDNTDCCGIRILLSGPNRVDKCVIVLVTVCKDSKSSGEKSAWWTWHCNHRLRPDWNHRPW